MHFIRCTGFVFPESPVRRVSNKALNSHIRALTRLNLYVFQILLEILFCHLLYLPVLRLPCFSCCRILIALTFPGFDLTGNLVIPFSLKTI